MSEIDPFEMESIDLFDVPVQHLSHKNDPQTSREAATKVRKSIRGQAMQIYMALKTHPNSTMKELWPRTGLDYFTVQKRISVLADRGYADRTGQVRDGHAVWRAI